jgi:hypothetical protein
METPKVFTQKKYDSKQVLMFSMLNILAASRLRSEGGRWLLFHQSSLLSSFFVLRSPEYFSDQDDGH